jgi:hypothetical protein
VKEVYKPTTKRHPTQLGALPTHPRLATVTASSGLLPSIQPAAKIVENPESKLMAHLSASVKESKPGTQGGRYIRIIINLADRASWYRLIATAAINLIEREVIEVDVNKIEVEVN